MSKSEYYEIDANIHWIEDENGGKWHSDAASSLVAGNTPTIDIETFIQRASVLLQEEQKKIKQQKWTWDNLWPCIPVTTKAKNILVLGAIKVIDHIIDGLHKDGLVAIQKDSECGLDNDGLLCVNTWKIAWVRRQCATKADPCIKDDFDIIEEKIIGTPKLKGLKKNEQTKI